MEDKFIQELSEVIQSSNINFLIGSGISTPFLPLLGNIENNLNASTTDKSREKEFKKYLAGVMLPNKKIISGDLKSDIKYNRTINAYKIFFQLLAELLMLRKSTILSKQVNMFTTNIDILMEVVLESLRIEYNDGFYGKLNPIFSVAHYKKSIYQRSLHYDHVSEIPVFNIIKMHGSLTWKQDGQSDNITYSHNLDHFDKYLLRKKDADFREGYRKILVVNPEEAKHLESVLNINYSELLRMYSSELEKDNAVLFVLGFSMEDKHIRNITLRAANSNPTLRIFFCCSNKNKNKMSEKLEQAQHPNIQMLTPDGNGRPYTIGYMTNNLLKKIIIGSMTKSNSK